MERSVKEWDRIVVLRRVDEEGLTAAAGAARLGMSGRHFRRLRRIRCTATSGRRFGASISSGVSG